MCFYSDVFVCFSPDNFYRADEMDEYDAAPRGVTEKYVLPTAPKGARAPDASDERIPRDPVNKTLPKLEDPISPHPPSGYL
jgi:hypothetical protein